MDAAYTYFKKTALFFATALLVAMPGRATPPTPPTFNLNSSGGSTANLTVGNQASSVLVDTSDSTQGAITFTTSTAYTNPPNAGWLTVTASGPLSTPVYLYLQVGNTSGMNAGTTYTATVTLTSTNFGNAVTGTIGVSFTSGGSGTGSGTINPSASSVVLSAASGASASTQLYLTTASATAISFSLPTPTTTSGGAWLTATASSYSVSATSNATLTIAVPNGLTLNNGTYYGTVTIQPNGGTSSTVSVTFQVGSGGGNGILSATPSSISWSFTSGSGVYPSSQTVALTSSIGATSYTASVDSSSTWLYANGTYPNTSGSISTGITVSVNGYINNLNTGNYTGYVYVRDQNNNPATITVNLSVNGGGSGNGISWSPNPVTVTAAVSGSQQQQQVSVTSTVAGTFNNASISGVGLSVSNVVTTSNTTGYVIVYGTPGNLSANTYVGSLVIYFTPTNASQISQSIPVSFVVGSGGGGTTPGVVTPTSLAFAYQTGTTVTSLTLPAQNIVVTGTGQYSVGTVTYASGQTGGWLTATASSTFAPGSVGVSINPSGLTSSTTLYTATVPVTTGIGTSNVAVSLLVSATPVLVAYPGSLNFNYQAGAANPSSPLYLNASDNSAMAVSASTSASWLSVGAPTQPNTSTLVTVQGNNLASLANGTYTGTVAVSATGAANSPVNVPVVLTVTGSTSTGGGNLTLGTSSMTFNATQNSTAPAAQTLSVSASTLTYYTASASTSSGGNWLSISPTGSLNTSSYSSIAVSVNQTGLGANTYYGTITLVANGFTQSVQVTLVVSSTTIIGGSGNVTVTANSQLGTPSLAFTYQVAGSTPAVQTLQVSSASGSSPVAFTIASSATWLSAGVANGTSLNTPVGFTVSIVNPSTLAAGPYNATITITPNGGTVVTVPVTLTVQAAPTVTATPTTLSFAYQAGAANPTPGTVNVSGGGQALGFTAQVTSGSNWLSVSPTSGTTPTTGTIALSATVTPGTLTAGVYTGTILVSATGTATNTTSITVTLTVTAPLPTINSVVNAGSSIKGSVSPGEIITIYGTALGPAAAAYATIDPSTGKLATTIGGVQVLFNGIPAPLFYASSTQVNAVVPYEMAPISSPSVWIKYVGQTSNAYSLNSTTTMPGLFTQNSQGSGPGAILNQDYSTNGPGNPAAKGSIVQVFMTGEGQTSPQGVTGKITAPNLPAPQVTPAPLLAVGVQIDGQPVLYTYAGEAPGFAAGLMQLNVQIPANARSGDLPIIVAIGGNFSQSNVTVSVR